MGHRVHRALRPGGNDDFVGTQGLAALAHLPPGNGLAQAEAAAHIGIMGVACQQAVDGRVDDGQGRIEIRVANRQQQNVAALLAQLQGSVMNIPGIGTRPSDSAGQRGKKHASLLVGHARSRIGKRICRLLKNL
ncbi:hypothetical protein D3C80_1104410 [compost metagenome]